MRAGTGVSNGALGRLRGGAGLRHRAALAAMDATNGTLGHLQGRGELRERPPRSAAGAAGRTSAGAGQPGRAGARRATARGGS
ncbi:hypothetical protein GCM10010331_62280 [Streptomyces xanthochromogenes]|nr:hypothetical protein GCM10010331_62280 [Streptomyces xanthochromogenes]